MVLASRRAAGFSLAATVLGVIAGAVGATLARAADEGKKAVPAAEIRELWVPAESLQAVLEKFPRAVTLTRAQYDTLVRDAAAPRPDDSEKPPAWVLGARATLVGNVVQDHVKIRAEYEIHSFDDGWTEIPLALDAQYLASVRVGDDAAVRVVPPAKAGRKQPRQKGAKAIVANPETTLIVRGAGVHRVVAEFNYPIERSGTGASIALRTPQVAAASLQLKMPAGVRIETVAPFTVSEPSGSGSLEAEFALPADSQAPLKIAWSTDNAEPLAGTALLATGRFVYSIDATRLEGDLGFVLSSNLRDIPGALQIDLPEGCEVLRVEGSELRRWNLQEGGVRVVLEPGERRVTDLRLVLEKPVLAGQSNALPLPRVKGAYRTSGVATVLGGEQVRVLGIETPELVSASVDAALRAHPDYVGSFSFARLPGELAVTVQQVEDRVSAEMDTLVELRRETISLTRTLTLAPVEGSLFESRVRLPGDEELIDVREAGGLEPEWTRIGNANLIQLRWKRGVLAGESRTVIIKTRRDPAGWYDLGEEEKDLAFTSGRVEGADKVSGYVAVRYDDSLRTEVRAESGLERRDGRTTPVAGTLAWFRSQEYELTLGVARRPAEVEAEIITYALPLLSTLEMNGELRLGISRSAIKQLTVTLPPEVAGRFFVESPLVAEKALDEETGAWTLTFHRELSGAHRLPFRMDVPLADPGAEADADAEVEEETQRRFSIEVPGIAVPDAARVTGQWLIEANTDTELSFDAEGLDALDTLRAPAIAGHQPRHRIIGSFAYRGDEHRLRIDGVRHEQQELVNTVIDQLNIDSVLSNDGADRHLARLMVRTAGDQFLVIKLPGGAQLWSLSVEDEPVKPVASEAEAGSLRVTLPQHADRDHATSIRLIYETRSGRWSDTGQIALEPIRFSAEIPVLRGSWRLHLPEGYSYREFESNFAPEFEIGDEPLLAVAALEKAATTVGDATVFRIEDMAGAAFEPMSEDRPKVVLEMKPTTTDFGLFRGGAAGGANFVENQTALMTSDDVLGAVVDKRGLAGQWGLDRGAAIQRLRSRVETRERRGTDLVELEVRGVDGTEAAVIANEIVTEFAGQRAEQARQLTERDLAALEQELAQQRERIEAARHRMLQVMKQHGIVDPTQAKQTTKAGMPVDYAQAQAHYRQQNDVLKDLQQKLSERAAELSMPKMPVIVHEYADAGAAFGEGQEMDALAIPMPAVVTGPVPALPEKGRKSVAASVQQKIKEGRQLASEGDYDGARLALQGALGQMAGAPETEALRQAAAQLYGQNTIQLARQRMDEGRVSESVALLEAVLAPEVAPGSPEARALLDELKNQRGLAPEEAARVAQVDKALALADGYLKLGDTAAASERYREVLSADAGNKNALARLESLKEGVADPFADTDAGAMDPFAAAPGEFSLMPRKTAPDPTIAGIQSKVAQIVIPKVEFTDTTLEEAIEFLRQKSRELDPEQDEMLKGVRFELPPGLDRDVRITLNLTNVPLAEALGDVVRLAGVTFRIEPQAVVVLPETMTAKTYKVPPTFLSASATGGAGADDPFAAPSDGAAGSLKAKMTAQSVLEAAGVTFPPGAEARYDAESGVLTVRNVPGQLELMDAFTSSLEYSGGFSRDPSQITTKFVEVAQANAEELGLNYLLVSGLIPLDFELPEAGRSFGFNGFYAPDGLSFDYVIWEEELRLAWLWILGGAVAGFILARRRPVVAGLFGIVLLSFIPLVLPARFAPDVLKPICNALLLGWSVAVIVIVIGKIARWVRKVATVKPLMAKGGAA